VRPGRHAPGHAQARDLPAKLDAAQTPGSRHPCRSHPSAGRGNQVNATADRVLGQQQRPRSAPKTGLVRHTAGPQGAPAAPEWDDRLPKTRGLRSKFNRQKQRQKVHIIGETMMPSPLKPAVSPGEPGRPLISSGAGWPVRPAPPPCGTPGCQASRGNPQNAEETTRQAPAAACMELRARYRHARRPRAPAEDADPCPEGNHHVQELATLGVGEFRASSSHCFQRDHSPRVTQTPLISPRSKPVPMSSECRSVTKDDVQEAARRRSR